jgi:hypothetical protein
MPEGVKFLADIDLPEKKRYNIKDTYVGQLVYASKYDIKKICEWLYDNATIYLERKFKIFEKFKNEVKDYESLERRVFHTNCSIRECDKKHKGKGYCWKHLREYNKYVLEVGG